MSQLHLANLALNEVPRSVAISLDQLRTQIEPLEQAAGNPAASRSARNGTTEIRGRFLYTPTQ